MSALALTFIFPLIGFLLLAFGRDDWSERAATIIGVGSMFLSALAALVVGWQFFGLAEASGSYPVLRETLWTWFQIGDFAPRFGLHLDGLSLTLLGVITGVGFLIHLFASWYMHQEAQFARFFSYMNLFVASMILLVLADNLLLMYLGWEGVGICSYLLIGFYYQERANGRAALKAFTVTRVGDVFLAIGLFLLFRELGTLNISEIVAKAPSLLEFNTPTTQLAALMLLGGAVGKSAQLPLQTWLADAMAGPTPVSALIHAATMVTAGVYLIARLHPVFLQAPPIHDLVGYIGAVTLVIAGLCALVQTDIKRVLAYSTMSQLGYMFVALGAGAWSAAVFHLMTHAFFKALLFLASGAVILACHHEQNILNMGGLRKRIPLVFWSFVVGGGALAALPFVTAGFFSKDEILWESWVADKPFLFWMGLFGAFLTAIYTVRLIVYVFFGQEKTPAYELRGLSYQIPLVILLVLSTFVGALIHPPLAGVLPVNPSELVANAGRLNDQHLIEGLAMLVALSGVALAAWLFMRRRSQITALPYRSKPAAAAWVAFDRAFGFDDLYDLIFVKPFNAIARLLGRDPLDRLWGVIPALSGAGNRLMTHFQGGGLRGYLASTVLGAIITIGVLLAWQIAQLAARGG